MQPYPETASVRRQSLPTSPIRKSGLAPEPSRADGVLGVVAAGSVGQNHDLFAIDEVQQRLPFRRFQVNTPDRHGYHIGSRTAMSRSEEHTSELQSHSDLVCRLLLEKKKQK